MSYTNGPWEWTEWGSGRLKLSTPDRGKLIVMDFVRQGMNGAVARFAHWDGIEDGAPRARIGGILENSVILKTGWHASRRPPDRSRAGVGGCVAHGSGGRYRRRLVESG